jgi:hypothetical protein
MLDAVSMILRFLEFFIQFELAFLLIQKKINIFKVFGATIICTFSFEFIASLLPQYAQSILCVSIVVILFKFLSKEKTLKIISILGINVLLLHVEFDVV